MITKVPGLMPFNFYKKINLDSAWTAKKLSSTRNYFLNIWRYLAKILNGMKNHIGSRDNTVTATTKITKKW